MPGVLNTINNTKNELESQKSILNLDKPESMGINETWLDHTALDQELITDNYTFCRKDKLSGRGGEICLLMLVCIKTCVVF